MSMFDKTIKASEHEKKMNEKSLELEGLKNELTEANNRAETAEKKLIDISAIFGDSAKVEGFDVVSEVSKLHAEVVSLREKSAGVTTRVVDSSTGDETVEVIQTTDEPWNDPNLSFNKNFDSNQESN